MDLPFTEDAFLEIFRLYNETIWPAQIAFYALGLLAVHLAFRGSARSSLVASGLLGLLWVWMGVVYHWGFFSRINPAALLFGALFLLQGALLVFAGLRKRLQFGARWDYCGFAGVALVAYSLFAYPILGRAAGHGFPSGATFGLPCPTTIFTFGLLLWSERRVDWWILVIPAAWSAVGFSAAAQLGIVEDYAMPIAAVAAIGMIARKNMRIGRAPRVETAPAA